MLYACNQDLQWKLITILIPSASLAKTFINITCQCYFLFRIPHQDTLLQLAVYILYIYIIYISYKAVYTLCKEPLNNNMSDPLSFLIIVLVPTQIRVQCLSQVWDFKTTKYYKCYCNVTFYIQLCLVTMCTTTDGLVIKQPYQQPKANSHVKYKYLVCVEEPSMVLTT